MTYCLGSLSIMYTQNKVCQFYINLQEGMISTLFTYNSLTAVTVSLTFLHIKYSQKYAENIYKSAFITLQQFSLFIVKNWKGNRNKCD